MLRNTVVHEIKGMRRGLEAGRSTAYHMLLLTEQVSTCLWLSIRDHDLQAFDFADAVVGGS